MTKLSFRLFPLTLVFGLFCATGAAGQEPMSSPTPVPPPTPVIEQSLRVPPVAFDFRHEPKHLPPLGRVGVDMEQQRPLSLREALTAALENNKDIEVARQNVKIAEFDLQGSRGAYDPRLSSASYFERI
ncbi:MAG: TolC family protein, partial [Pyrinomonadaceae bacterium]|nr:TolC family protein [Pyrinomonadaceae bacterium]